MCIKEYNKELNLIEKILEGTYSGTICILRSYSLLDDKFIDFAIGKSFLHKKDINSFNKDIGRKLSLKRCLERNSHIFNYNFRNKDNKELRKAIWYQYFKEFKEKNKYVKISKTDFNKIVKKQIFVNNK